MTGLRAVVFDWAGTVVDFGSRAPIAAFVRVFADFGVPIAVEEARRPMGLAKRAHIAALGGQPRIALAWKARHGHDFGEADIDRIYQVFEPFSARVVTEHAELIPGTVETVTALRQRGIRIGSTTGYPRAIMQPLLRLAAGQGYAPDNLVCAGDLAEGRPSPMMMYRCFLDLGVWPAAACVKVDDTAPGIAEGLSAGCWTVGVSLTGNALGLSREALAALPADEQARRGGAAAAELSAAGAHYVIDGVGDLLPVIDAIAARLLLGERP